MKKLSMFVVSLVGGAGLTFAQGTQQPGAQPPASGSAAPPQTARAGERTKPGATTEPRTGARAQTEKPKPPPEVGEMVKTMGTRARCTGTAMGGPEMNTEMKLTSNVTSKVDLDGWFVRSVMN